MAEDTLVSGNPTRIEGCTRLEIIDRAGSLPKAVSRIVSLNGTNMPNLKPTDFIF